MSAVSTLAVVYGSIASRRQRLGVGHFQLRLKAAGKSVDEIDP